MKIGLDIGSTTIKCVVLDENDNLIYKAYERHYSHIVEKAAEVLARLDKEICKGESALLSISGSAGMGLATACDVPFVQEVFATRVATKRYAPDADVVIELGGEDAKILFLTHGTEVRMNGSCAGGTGAFIDQMATLLKMTPDEMNDAAQHAEKTYTIASRCGVFAKSDIQPLLNQGAKTGDVAASIFYAVVNQTIAGLAQGRVIEGNVLYLGGPLTFLPQLKKSFDKVLKLTGTCPENSLYYVALGAALYSDKALNLTQVANRLEKYSATASYAFDPPLFASKEEYEAFRARHAKASVPRKPFTGDVGKVYIGIDAGSTTVKAAVIDEQENLLFTSYQPNSGNPIPIIRQLLLEIYHAHPNLEVGSVTATGYGEDIVKSAFGADYGVVETVAHFTAAKHFMPDVDFVIDIGGQDMKCFKIENGAISNIFLNEACSSGCGSFLQTFAQALGYDVPEFAKLALFADRPVDLGSRCTVFMNSSVKQAQKDGASIENISAGLAISVVKNALYKVIRASGPEELGKKIVVQGGTFYNEAVLRAFEQEMKVEVIRPDIAGLMGAFGAALYGKAKGRKHSTLLSQTELENFTQEVRNVACGLCGNNCQLTVNLFPGGKKYISGNRCDRPVTHRGAENPLNLYEYKLHLLESYKPEPGPRGTIGLPLALNMYELLPFWHTFFTKLGFSVVNSGVSSRKMYLEGQSTIPSDTVCYPAKLVHGHIHRLSKMAVNAIFYPCMTYNVDEGLGDNCYNCPVVAYYPEVIAANCHEIREMRFLYDYVDIHRRKDFVKKIGAILSKTWPDITRPEVYAAAQAAYTEYESHMAQVRTKAVEIIAKARSENRQIIVLAGRPYHVDPEINHGIDKLICSHDAAVITEDSISHLVEKFPTSILNQWTYHSRLYAAAKYIADQPDMNLVQLVSFGCGVDAITTDETREILQGEGKLYTQIKIDEIANLGAVNIRLRSLFAALEQ
ncbi:acyl-CoA dehydratase activase [uncultured Ruthenibacterium sp.]|uniref:acyl-CoA dehydratase activase n=1 Tax=uncultured Ruthenibacterium sp. TaxID=1905347 RepID=UPI00349EDAEE